MSTYVIIADNNQKKAEESLKKAYPITSKTWSSGVFFLQTDDTPQEVGDKIGVVRTCDNKVVSGDLNNILIFSITRPYWGASTIETWDWLQAAFEGSDG